MSAQRTSNDIARIFAGLASLLRLLRLNDQVIRINACWLVAQMGRIIASEQPSDIFVTIVNMLVHV